MVSLRQLRYLESLAENRHFGRAAQACAVSQPALSMQIKELEEDQIRRHRLAQLEPQRGEPPLQLRQRRRQST